MSFEVSQMSFPLYVFPSVFQTFLLGLRFEDMSWEYAEPKKCNDRNCMPCLFIQFPETENHQQVTKVLQVFSREVGNANNLSLNNQCLVSWFCVSRLVEEKLILWDFCFIKVKQVKVHMGIVNESGNLCVHYV